MDTPETPGAVIGQLTLPQAWVCPVCNRGVAPTEKTCDHAGTVGTFSPQHFTLTGGTNAPADRPRGPIDPNGTGD